MVSRRRPWKPKATAVVTETQAATPPNSVEATQLPRLQALQAELLRAQDSFKELTSLPSGCLDPSIDATLFQLQSLLSRINDLHGHMELQKPTPSVISLEALLPTGCSIDSSCTSFAASTCPGSASTWDSLPSYSGLEEDCGLKNVSKVRVKNTFLEFGVPYRPEFPDRANTFPGVGAGEQLPILDWDASDTDS